MPDLPVGVVTFLLTDVVGSTRLWEHYPEDMRRSTVRHDELIQAIVAEHDGILVRPRGEGDSRFAVFRRASDGVAAACGVQRALRAEAWPLPEPLSVRLALHTGEADLRDGDYYGTTINRCARMRDAAHGGQIVLSGITSTLARERLPDRVTFRSLGRHKLRDLPEADEILQLLHPDLPSEFPPLRTLSASPHNLPVQLTSFVGRDQELRELRQLVLEDEVRLVTVTGAAGTGKTRLSLRAAEECLSEFPRGVFFVDLAPLKGPDLLASTIGEAIGIREVAGQPFLRTIVDALQTQGVLLVLDNFEHIVEQSRQVTELLSRCAALKILVTSREVLHLTGERVFTLAPMGVPDAREVLSAEDVLTYEAVQLFIERARAVKPNFAITVQNVPAIIEICSQLDGLPLAIELAAARVQLLPPDALVERLGTTYRQRQSLLTTGGSDRPERHQALSNAIDWSYGLLRPSEQRLFRRLAVFSGGFTLAAAEAICSGDDELRDQILDGISSLIDKSLLRPAEESGREARCRMLETIRAFALMQLEAAGEFDSVHRLLAEQLVRLAEEAEPILTGPEQVEWLNRLESEHGNFRTALQWCEKADADLALRLSAALWRFWSTRGYLGEGLRWLESAVAAPGADQSPALARALNGAANLARENGDYSRAEMLHQASVSLCRGRSDVHGTAEGLNNLGLIALYRGQHENAQRYCEEGLALFRQIGDPGGIAAALNNLGNVARERGDSEAAARLHHQSLALRREIGDKRGIALSLNNLANVVLNQGDYWRAAGLHEESLALRRALGDRAGVASSLNNLGNVARVRGDFQAARGYYEESLAIRRELGDKRRVAAALGNLAIVERQEGHRDRAATLLWECLTLRREVGDQAGINAALDVLGTLAENQSDAAARLYHEALLTVRREKHDQAGIVAALTSLGKVALAQGDMEAARACLEESLSVRRQIGDRRGVAISLAQLGALALDEHDLDRAESLLQQALAVHLQVQDRRGAGATLKGLARVAEGRGDIELARDYCAQGLSVYEDIGDRRNIQDCRERLAALSEYA